MPNTKLIRQLPVTTRAELLKCKRGHQNWHITKAGKLCCRTCENDRRYYARRGLSTPQVG